MCEYFPALVYMLYCSSCFFNVNMLPRGSSLKTDVKFNTCLTNEINVRFFVKCQLLINGLCFWYYLRKISCIILLWTKYTFDSGYKYVPSTLKGKPLNLFSIGDLLCFFGVFCFSLSRCRIEELISAYVLEKPNLSMWFKDEKLR